MDAADFAEDFCVVGVLDGKCVERGQCGRVVPGGL